MIVPIREVDCVTPTRTWALQTLPDWAARLRLMAMASTATAAEIIPPAASKKPFAPRIGFAYRLTDKTVVRGGYGLFFDSAETREIDDSGDIYPFVVRASPNPNVDPTLPKLTDNMFPAVPLHQVTPALDGSQFFAVIISEFPRNPYVQQWSLSVQRELARNTTLEVNYVGNKGTHLLNRTNYGQGLPPANPALCDPSTGGDPTVGDCPKSARRPFPNITSSLGFLGSQWNGYSSYNAGNVKLERRSSSIALVAVYTWAKSLDDKSAAAGVGSTNAFAGHMNEHNQALDYGRSDFDVNHRFVTSVVYQLPVGRGKRFGGNMNRAADLAIGGWQVTGITTFQKGFPYSILANDNFGLLTTFTQRANLVPGCNPNSGFHQEHQRVFQHGVLHSAARRPVRQQRPRHPARAGNQQLGHGHRQRLQIYRARGLPVPC